MEAYHADDRNQPIKYFKAIGRSLIQPTVTTRSIGWPTDRGHFYVSNSSRLDSRYRLVAQDTVVAPAGHMDDKWFVASVDGYCYCVHEMSGDVFWRFSSGQPIMHQPVAVGDSCYVITADDTLYSVNIETGQEQWWATGIRKFLAASSNRVYGVDRGGRMIIIDIRTGSRIGMMDIQGLDYGMINTKTDRLYVGKKSGVIQCLRESDIKHAIVHAGIGGIEEEKPQVNKRTRTPRTTKTNPRPAAEMTIPSAVVLLATPSAAIQNPTILSAVVAKLMIPSAAVRRSTIRLVADRI